MNTPIPEDQLAPIKEAIYRGQKIQAIKLYRAATGTELIDAKHAVEQLETELRASAPENFKAPTDSRGCLGMVVALCCFAVLLVAWLIAH